ncbi:hypothetical protein AciX9_2425 [Granulicella tundricola MP5ACTX9]|uniref:Uncharacterized protein n=1 Tax=Granulicella tundricola (strain ATCC BAA-1859 / DSM 23138 / MP5ACTX9) TaxID=1198114 RepID=E8X5B4_GRATM|nr:hypothetical protein AciX9_2425 [Granulicella tundricola MP5ACTX9]
MSRCSVVGPFVTLLSLSACTSLLAGCSSSGGTAIPPHIVATQHILFVGDSFTHGRYAPVRTYNSTPGTGGLGSTAASPLVVDENFNTTVTAREENSPGETGPWGGIPGIFAELAAEAAIPYDVHIEAISATSLNKNYQAAQSVIAQSVWNTVVLQEATFEPIPPSLSGDSISKPATFCSAVGTIEQGVHAAAPSASVYLYETGAPADTAYGNSTASSAFSDSAYLSALGTLTDAYHDAYLTAATQDGHIAGVAATGDAWSRAWSEGIANPDPYGGSAAGVSLTFNYQPGSQPSTTSKPTDAGFHHPSIYGAYLNGLVLFQKITGTDVRTFGGTEKAAQTLGISAAVAVQLQQIAWESVTMQNTQLVHPTVNACALTQ